MTINIPYRIRAGIYIANIFLVPIAYYLRAKGYIGDLEMGLFTAEFAAAFVLAGLNTSPKEGEL